MSVNLVTYRPSYQTLFVGVAAVSIVALLAYAFFSRKSSQQYTPKAVLSPKPTPSPLAQEIEEIKDKIRETIPLVDKLNDNVPLDLLKKLSANTGTFSDPQTSAKVDLKQKTIQLDSKQINAQTLDKICQYITGSIICSYNASAAHDPIHHLFYRKDASSFVYIPPAPPTSHIYPSSSWIDQLDGDKFPGDEVKQNATNEAIYKTLEQEKETTFFTIWDNRSAGAKVKV